MEHLDLPVPQGTLDRLLSGVREPFITDFCSFATAYLPGDQWTIERAKAAASLRAVRAACRAQRHIKANPTVDDGKPRSRSLPEQIRQASSSIGPGRIYSRFSKLLRARRSLSAKSFDPVIPAGTRAEITAAGPPVQFAATAIPDSATFLTIYISLQAAGGTGPQAILEIAAPGVVLNHWRPVVPGASHVVVQVPAALFTMRRIGHIELRALKSPVSVPFSDVRLEWHILPVSSEIYANFAGLFDASWYDRKRPSFAEEEAVALWHYAEAGWLDGRNPSQSFDANAYLRRHPDVAAAQINPLLHAVMNGHAGKRGTKLSKPASARVASHCPIDDDYRLIAASGYFDAQLYCTTYPDVRQSDLDPLGEYLHGGWRARRAPGPRFDADWYLRNNPDVAAADLNPLIHHLQFGMAEGRQNSRGALRVRPINIEKALSAQLRSRKCC